MNVDLHNQIPTHRSTRPVLAERLERLRCISGLTGSEWQDLLGLTWKDYCLLRAGLNSVSFQSLERLAEHLKFDVSDLLEGTLDYHAMERAIDRGTWQRPEKYSIGLHGRKRTTITTFEYLEAAFGWRLRHDVLRHFQMSELALIGEFDPVTIRFITDVCDYLRRRQFKDLDFYSMGYYSYEGNQDTILAEVLGQFPTSAEVLDHLWTDLLPLYEQNCDYRFLSLDRNLGVLEVKSDPHVAAELGVKHLGSSQICLLKSGMMASAPMYIGEPPATVHERSCVHADGSDSCVFEIRFKSGDC